MSDLLDQTCQRIAAAKEAGETPVVVFDLDGTLFDNGPRTHNALARFFSTAHMDEERRALVDLPTTKLPYLLKDTMARLGIEDEDVVKAASKVWFERFFSDDAQAHDLPLPGAHAFVERCYDDGATVVYLTGRDVPGMGTGCFESLRSHGFPIGLVRTVLVMKHDFETTDLAFKSEAVDFIGRLGRVVASFDNEPGNCNLFLERWPGALVGLCDTQHAPDAPPLSADAVRFFDFA